LRLIKIQQDIDTLHRAEELPTALLVQVENYFNQVIWLWSIVLVPNYHDPNDKIANAAIQKLYPDRKVIGIDVRELYKDGGMIHCVTQQQPADVK